MGMYPSMHLGRGMDEGCGQRRCTPPSLEAANEAGGTHPTEMHSCYINMFVSNRKGQKIVIISCIILKNLNQKKVLEIVDMHVFFALDSINAIRNVSENRYGNILPSSKVAGEKIYKHRNYSKMIYI